MTNKDSASSESSKTSTIRMGNNEMHLTLTQAKQIANALKHYLETNPHVANIPMLNDESDAWLQSSDEAIIDFQGSVRIGSWLLQTRSDEPVLIYRRTETGQSVGYQYVATLHLNDNQWSVAEISWEKIFHSR